MDVKTFKNAQKGDEAAFFQIMSQQKKQLYRVAYSYLKNEQDALEAIQEVTFRAYKNIKIVKEPKFFATWITRIMINYCVNELKRDSRLLLQEYENNNSVIEDHDNRIHVQEALQQLEPRYQEIIILKYYQDLTIEQIAESVGRPIGTVKTWLNKALTFLRGELKKGGDFHV